MGGWFSEERARRYLSRAGGNLPHVAEGEEVLLEMLPNRPLRVLDLGSGDGRLLELVMAARPGSTGVALDASPLMLQRARERFAEAEGVRVTEHDLNEPLTGMGPFDAVVSRIALHHLAHERKRALYEEVFEALEPGGAFLNLDRVASPTPALRRRFLEAMGHDPDAPHDPEDRPLDLGPQLSWLSATGFDDVDCYWKWLELALFGGTRPRRG